MFYSYVQASFMRSSDKIKNSVAEYELLKKYANFVMHQKESGFV